MPFYTPLRYPGGKRRLLPVVTRLLDESRLTDIEYSEAYAGGASIGLALLLEERAANIHINDLSRPVFAFWNAVLNHTTDLCSRIQRVKVTMREWERQRAVYDNRERAGLDDLGFSTMFLNRTNRSGILAGGVIGGKSQNGNWKIDARFNKSDLIQRIKRIARYRTRIHLYQRDALDFTNTVVRTLGARSLAFYDPPYIENGEDLYLNDYNIEGHRQLAVRVAELDQPWVVTYDHAAVKAQLYPTHRRIVYGLNYTAQGRYKGREVMFLGAGVSVPRDWTSGRIELSPLRSKVDTAVYGKMENMKPAAEMDEGPAAFERFRKAVKTIVAVPKDTVAKKAKRTARKRSKASGRKR